MANESNNKDSNSNASKDEADKFTRYEGEGVVFKAKLIGSELVMEPKGDKMCQNSIQRLKAIIKGTNSHKRRIVLKISYDGVKVYDEKTGEILHHHEVSQISYIASDETDTRTFGYVSDVPSKAHQFICFKTSGPAINVMSVISSLFEAVLEKKNLSEKPQEQKSSHTTNSGDTGAGGLRQQDSIDLVGGDSGIMDGDVSVTSEDNINKQNQKQSSGSIFANDHITSSSNSFGSNNSGSNVNTRSINNISNGPQASSNNLAGKKSPSTDLIFDDLFAGLSDPIIVGKNETSLISYNPLVDQGVNLSSSVPWADQQHHPLQGSNSSTAILSSSAGIPLMPPPRQISGGQVGSNGNLSSGMNIGQFTPSPPVGRPIPRRQNQHNQQQHPHSGLLPPPSSLPRPAPMMSQAAASAGQTIPNRSLVYNHSSVSLSDASLTRQASFVSSSSHNDSAVDRYAVFNEIDNLPSIFESTSLGNVKNVQNLTSSAAATMRSSSTTDATMFRQTNPFDDDFFA